MSKEAMRQALEALEQERDNYQDWDKEDGAPEYIYEAITALREALAAQQEGILTRKWILHGGFADVASFDADGVPSFYWKESVAKFNDGELSAPCKGKNCGSLNGWLHSAECRAEHEAQYTAPQPAQRKPLTLGQKQRLWSSVGDKPTLKDRVNAYGLAIEAAHGIKENT